MVKKNLIEKNLIEKNHFIFQNVRLLKTKGEMNC